MTGDDGDCGDLGGVPMARSGPPSRLPPPPVATVSTDETKDLAAVQPPVNRACPASTLTSIRILKGLLPTVRRPTEHLGPGALDYTTYCIAVFAFPGLANAERACYPVFKDRYSAPLALAKGRPAALRLGLN